ncbi:MAG: glycosyl transferase family 2 [uncultured bacterium]|nr:MAG: glycosyl transferase family 2 [uncultured bacterium]
MLSTVLITKNEEHNIKNCVDHLIDWVDEIVVFDSGSTDRTVAILQEYRSPKIKIQQIEWQGFARTKNLAIEAAVGDWILSVDADEVITPELKNEILDKMRSAGANGFLVPRLLYFCGRPVRYGGSYPDYQLRLFKKVSGRFVETPVHEYVRLDGEPGRLKNHMLHYSYRTMFDYWARLNRYTELDAEKKFQQGKKFRFYRVLVLPLEIFKRLYLKMGILDGFPGIFYHIFSAVSSLVKYAKLWEYCENKQ